MRKFKELPKKTKRTIAGVMAVVIAGSAVGPLFSVLSFAGKAKSFNYIEQIKADHNESRDAFKVLEILPDQTETTMGYYINGNDPVDSLIEIGEQAIAADPSYNSTTRQAARKNYVNNTLYATLKSKGIIGSGETYPMTVSSEGYTEYYPWQVKKVSVTAPVTNDDGTQTEVTFEYTVPNTLNPTEKNPTKLKEIYEQNDLTYIELTASEKSSATGTYSRVDVDNGEIGDYEITATYNIAQQNIFDFSAWSTNTKSFVSNNPPSTLGGNGMRIAATGNGINCYVNTYYKTSGESVHDFYTMYGQSADYYNMPLVPGRTYTVSFDYERSSEYVTGGQFFLFLFDQDYKYCYYKEPVEYLKSVTTSTKDWAGVVTTKVTETTLTTSAGNYFAVNDQGNITESGHYEYTFTVPETTRTDGGADSVPAYCQICFGSCKKNITTTTTTPLKFYNISIVGQGGGNFNQSIQYFEYTADGSAAVDGAYYYAVKETAICKRDQWENLADNVAIYTKQTDDEGKEHYVLFGISGNGEDIILDGQKALDEANPYYFTLEPDYAPTKTVNGKTINVLPISTTPDDVHCYQAIPNYTDTYTLEGDLLKSEPDYIDVNPGTGYFNAGEVVFEYMPGNGRYSFTETTGEGSITTEITTEALYYNKGLTGNSLFNREVFDSYDGDDFPYFFSILETRTPESMVNSDAFLDSILFKNLIVISAGTGLATSKYKDDIPSKVKSAILEAAGSENKIPVVVDVSLIAPSNPNALDKANFPNLYSLIEELSDLATVSKNVSIANGGVRNNIYAFNSADIGSSCFATNKFTTEISDSSLVSSPYYDVWEEIHEENLFRKAYRENETLMEEKVSQATCLRAIINYAGRRIRAIKDEIRVLDIEPYTSRPYREFTDVEKLNGIATLSALEVMSWLPDTMVDTEVKNGKTQYIYNGKINDPIETEEDAAKYIKITTMSVAELNSVNKIIMGNYDMVYIGDSVDNIVSMNSSGEIGDKSRAVKEYGSWMFKYNDENISGGEDSAGLLYTNIGDTFRMGNVNYGDSVGEKISGTASGKTLAGLLREDYTKLTNSIWNLPASYTFDARTDGNDISDDVRKQLEEFAAAGLPIVYANKLCEVPQSEVFTIDIVEDAYYRQLENKNYQYFVFFVAHLNGALAANVKVDWTWYYKKPGETEGKEIRPKYDDNGKKVAGKDGEPIAKYYDQKTKEWYSMLGYINWDGTIGVEAYTDVDTKSWCADGMAIPGSNDWQKVSWDGNGNGNIEYYVTATLRYEGDSASKRQLYNNKKITSGTYGLKQETKEFKVEFTQNTSGSKLPEKGGGTKTIIITPNPYYTPQVGLGPDATNAQIKAFDDNGRKMGGKDEGSHFELLTVKKFNDRQYEKENDGGDVTYKNIYDKNQLKVSANCGEGHDYTNGLWGLGRDMSFDFFTFYIYGYCRCYGTQKLVEKKADEWTWLGNFTNGTHKVPYKLCTIVEPSTIPQTKLTSGSDGVRKVDMDVVDNTSNLYKFMSQAYSDVTATADEIRAAATMGYVLENREGLSNVMSVYEIKQDKGKVLGEALKLSPPSLIVDEGALQSYDEKHPQSLSNNTLRVKFHINCDTDVTKSQYYVNLYIDSNHDAVFSETERVPITTLKTGGKLATQTGGQYIAKSSTSDETTYYEYTMEKQLPSTYEGVIPWKLKVEDTENKYYHDSYIGYAYIDQDNTTVIHALQVLPADSWSQAASARMGGIGDWIDYENYSLRGTWMGTKNKGVENAGDWYKGSVFMGVDSKTWYGGTSRDYNYVIYPDNNSKRPNKLEEFNRVDANGNVDTSHDFYVYTAEDYANDGFYQLTIDPDSKLKRTVYYEDISAQGIEYDPAVYQPGDSNYLMDSTGSYFVDKDGNMIKTTTDEVGNKVLVNPDDYDKLVYVSGNAYTSASEKNKLLYRTHVVLWVNPEGEKTEKKNPVTGETMTDFYGNPIYEYKGSDFEVDIALTDIYELNNYIYADEQAASTNQYWIHQYDMCILGFGDSYGKNTLAEYIVSSKATQGFNTWAAWAIEDYVNSSKPLLFCHDTTNHEVNFITYIGQSALAGLSKIYDKVATWWTDNALPALKNFGTNVKNWWYKLIGRDDKVVQPPTNVDSSMENDIEAVCKDSRQANGYYNNLLLRVPLKQDRYGITYMINKVMDDKESNGKTHWQNDNYRAGHAYTWILDNYYQDKQNGLTNQPWKSMGLESAEKDGYVSKAEMLGEHFTIAYAPGTAAVWQTAAGDSVVMYDWYNKKAYQRVVDTDKKGTVKKETATYTNYETYTVADYKNNTTKDIKFGGDVKATYVKQTQGFTKWTVTRYGTQQSDLKSTYLPIGVGYQTSTDKTTGDRDPYYTNAVTQVNKGSITTYPYDINTVDFGGTTGGSNGKIKVHYTHEQVYQADLNEGVTTVWYCLADPVEEKNGDLVDKAGVKNYDLVKNDGANSYYIYTSGNLTYTGAGHTNMFTKDEAKLFINTLIAAYRLTEMSPTVGFMNDTGTEGITSKIITAEIEETKQDDGSYLVTSVKNLDDKAIIGVKVVDPNISSATDSAVTVRFSLSESADGASLGTLENVGTLYTQNNNGTLGGQEVHPSDNIYSVASDTVYYFYVPQSVIDELEKAKKPYVTLYAQAVMDTSTNTPSVVQSVDISIGGGLSDIT